MGPRVGSGPGVGRDARWSLWEARGSPRGSTCCSFQPPQGDRNKPTVPQPRAGAAPWASASWTGGRESGDGGSEGEGWGVRSPSGETRWAKGPSLLLGSADPVPASGFCPGCEATLRRARVGSGWGGPGRLAWGPRAPCQGWKPVTWGPADWAVDSSPCPVPRVGARVGTSSGEVSLGPSQEPLSPETCAGQQ